MQETLGLPAALDGRLWLYLPNQQTRMAHHHAEIEFNLLLEGRAAYLLGDRRYEMRRNALVWLFPEQDHLLLDQSPDYRLWIGVFTPSLLERVCMTGRAQPLLQANPPGYFCRHLSDGQASRLCALLEEICAVHANSAHYNAGLGYALLSAWAAFEAADDVPLGSDVHRAVEQAARLMRDESEPLSVDQIAKRVGLSASRLSRLFSEQIGVGLAEFRNAQRLQRFLQRYGRGGNLSASEAALDAGFGSYPQFHRVFTQSMGCSPSEYRRRNRRAER